MGAELVGVTSGATGNRTYVNVYTDIQATENDSRTIDAAANTPLMLTDALTSGVNHRRCPGRRKRASPERVQFKRQ